MTSPVEGALEEARPLWQAVPDLRRAFSEYYRARQEQGLAHVQPCCEHGTCSVCELFEVVEAEEQAFIIAAARSGHDELREALEEIRDMNVEHHDPGLTTRAHMKSQAFNKMRGIAARALSPDPKG